MYYYHFVSMFELQSSYREIKLPCLPNLYTKDHNWNQVIACTV